MRFAILMLITAALAGCKLSTVMTVYASDAVAVHNGETGLEAPVEMLVQVLTREQCEEYGPQFAQALVADFTGCASQGASDYVKLRRMAPIVSGDIYATQPASMFQIVVQAAGTPEAPALGIGAAINWGEIDAAWLAMPEETRRYRDRPDFEIALSATVSNDLRGDRTVHVRDVFADGAPFPTEGQFTLKRRSEVEIALSDVGNTYLQRNGAAWIATLALEDGDL